MNQGFTLPIIGVSAGAMDEERRAMLDAGVNGQQRNFAQALSVNARYAV